MKGVKVTFSRVYEVPVEIINNKLDLDIDNTGDEDIKLNEAKRIASDWLYDELPDFLENIECLVSANAEIIE